jgi:hypothetical protein
VARRRVACRNGRPHRAGVTVQRVLTRTTKVESPAHSPKPAEMERVLAFNRGHEEIETRI